MQIFAYKDAVTQYHNTPKNNRGKGRQPPKETTRGSVCGGFSRGTPLERGSNVAPLPGFFCQAFFHLEKKRSEGHADADTGGEDGSGGFGDLHFKTFKACVWTENLGADALKDDDGKSGGVTT